MAFRVVSISLILLALAAGQLPQAAAAAVLSRAASERIASSVSDALEPVIIAQKGK